MSNRGVIRDIQECMAYYFPQWIHTEGVHWLIGKSVRTEPLLYENAENGSPTAASKNPKGDIRASNASSCVLTPKTWPNLKFRVRRGGHLANREKNNHRFCLKSRAAGNGMVSALRQIITETDILRYFFKLWFLVHSVSACVSELLPIERRDTGGFSLNKSSIGLSCRQGPWPCSKK